jgi:hypothetical protein
MIAIEQPDVNWLECLPRGPQMTLVDLVQGGTAPQDAIALWLGGSREGRISPMGGASGERPRYTELFYKEMHLLLCTTDSKYKALREQFPKINKGTIATASSVIATTLAPSLGMATALVTPAVVLLFIALGRVGHEAWCKSTQG